MGYPRALRRGPFVCVSGTTATDGSGGIVGMGNPRAQTVQALSSVRVAGAETADVGRTRIYVVDITRPRPAGRPANFSERRARRLAWWSRRPTAPETEADAGVGDDPPSSRG